MPRPLWDIAPACTVVTQGYGPTDWNGEWACPAAPGGYFHAGIDISGANVFRTPVLATRTGVVSAIGIQYLGDQAVAVRTDEGVTIEYGHLDEARVVVGQRVKLKDVLGLLGTKGNSTGPHLHVEVRVDGPLQGVDGCPQNDPTRDPTPYLKEAPLAVRTMYDGITAGNLPTNAEIVAGYVEGNYTWSQTDWDRFPNSLKVTIAIWNADADVLDIETGDATPGMAPNWVQRQIARGAFPTVYCNRSTWPAVQSALARNGYQNGKHYDLWLADYTQTPHCPPEAAACQYADPGPYDLSLCQDYWPRGKGADTMAVLSDAQAQQLLAEVHETLLNVKDVHQGMGWLVSVGPGQHPAILQILDKLAQHDSDAAKLAALQTALNAISGKIAAPPAIDVAALATALAAHLPPSVDTKAVAQAVVNEIGVRVRPSA